MLAGNRYHFGTIGPLEVTNGYLDLLGVPEYFEALDVLIVYLPVLEEVQFGYFDEVQIGYFEVLEVQMALEVRDDVLEVPLDLVAHKSSFGYHFGILGILRYRPID